MAHARTHNGVGGPSARNGGVTNGAARPPRPASTVVRHHRGRSEDEALERFRRSVAKQQEDALYPITLSWSNGHNGHAKNGVELAVTYLRRT